MADEGKPVQASSEQPFDEEKGNTAAQFEEEQDATWGDVAKACCVHTPEEWGYVALGTCGVLFFLYFFLFALDLLGTSAKVIGGCAAGGLFPDDTNPIGGLMIGILATVFLQSSSTTTSVIVGLVGGSVLGVDLAIYMIMGANIGTSVTNTIVSMGHLGDADQLERAFAGATVHDMFNFLTVAVLLPVEAATGYLKALSQAMLPDDVDKGKKWEGPLKKIVSPLTKKVISANKNVIKDLAKGKVESCDSYYPTTCANNVTSYKNCEVGLIACDKKSGKCPVFFQIGATQKDDEVAGGVCLFLSLVILVICMIGLLKILQKMLMSQSKQVIYKATNINPYIAILLGVGITLLVQSSSITTSALTPLVGLDAIRLEQMLPLTLGANIGTTFTGLLASLVSDKIEALQVAICHLFFNITGIIIWFPIPFMRNIPLTAARKLGKATRVWKGFPPVYILVVFFALPALLLGLSTLFEQGSPGMTALGSFLVVIIGCGLVYFLYWLRFKNGSDYVVSLIETREIKNRSVRSLPEDMAQIKSDLAAIKAHTGMGGEVDKAEEA